MSEWQETLTILGTVERKASALSTALGAVIRGRYKKIGMSQETLAQLTGITITTIQRAVAGKAELDMDQVFAIADSLNTSATSLIAEAEADLGRLELSGASSTPISIDTKRKQNEARAMTVEQIEAQKHAATRDTEMDTDEPD